MKVQSTATVAQTANHATSKNAERSGEENAGLFSIQIKNILSHDKESGVFHRDAHREAQDRDEIEESANPRKSEPAVPKSRNIPDVARGKKTFGIGAKQTGSGEIRSETGVGAKMHTAVPNNSSKPDASSELSGYFMEPAKHTPLNRGVSSSAGSASGTPEDAPDAHSDDSLFSRSTGAEVAENEIPGFSIPETGDPRSNKSDRPTVIALENGIQEPGDCTNEETNGFDACKGGVVDKKHPRLPVEKQIISAGFHAKSGASNLKSENHNDRETNSRFAMSHSHPSPPESGSRQTPADENPPEAGDKSGQENAGAEGIRQGQPSPDAGDCGTIETAEKNRTGNTDSGEKTGATEGNDAVSVPPEQAAKPLVQNGLIDESGRMPRADTGDGTFPASDKNTKLGMNGDRMMKPNGAVDGKSNVSVREDPEIDTDMGSGSVPPSSGEYSETSGSTKKMEEFLETPSTPGARDAVGRHIQSGKDFQAVNGSTGSGDDPAGYKSEIESSQKVHQNQGAKDTGEGIAQNGNDFRSSTGIDVNRDLHAGNKSETRDTMFHARSGSGKAPDINVSSTGADSGSDGAKQDGRNGGQNEFPRFNAETAHAKEGIPASVKPSHAANTTQSGTASVTSGESLRGLETNSPGVHNPGKPAAPFFDPLTPQISEKIQFLVRDGGGVLRIRLQPDEFGEMEIQAETTSKGLVARIAAESAHVKNYLESSLHALQQHLQDQGMKVDRIQVTLQDGSDFQGSSNHSSKSGHSNSGQNGPHRSLNVFRNTGQSAAADSTDTQFYYPEKRFHTVA